MTNEGKVRPFATTPAGEIIEALYREATTQAVRWEDGTALPHGEPEPIGPHFRLLLDAGSLLCLLDVLLYGYNQADNLKLADWSRQTRITILAKLKLGER